MITIHTIEPGMLLEHVGEPDVRSRVIEVLPPTEPGRGQRVLVEFEHRRPTPGRKPTRTTVALWMLRDQLASGKVRVL
jgi:hypothetical protein